MDFNEYIIYRKNYKSLFFPNPFSEFGFNLYGEDTFSEGCDHHLLKDISIRYESLNCFIYFEKKNSVLAVAALNMILLNAFNYDDFAKLKFNNQIVFWTDSYIQNSNKLLILCEKSYLNNFIIEINFSSFEFIKYNRQFLVYTIENNKLDNYYFNLEFKRWNIKN